MKIGCELIRDLLPLYVDGICSKESARLVETHLDACAECKKQYEAMHKGEAGTGRMEKDVKLADGLRMLKHRMGKRTRIAVAGSVAAVLGIVLCLELLFNVPLKNLEPSDVQVTANVYHVSELSVGKFAAGDGSVEITKSEDDQAGFLNIQIPAMPNAEICMPENLIDEVEYVCIVQWNSKYHIKEIVPAAGMNGDSDTVYIKEIKTTLLNNAVEDEAQQISTWLEMGRINRIVYVDDRGGETVLWEA